MEAIIFRMLLNEGLITSAEYQKAILELNKLGLNVFDRQEEKGAVIHAN